MRQQLLGVGASCIQELPHGLYSRGGSPGSLHLRGLSLMQLMQCSCASKKCTTREAMAESNTGTRVVDDRYSYQLLTGNRHAANSDHWYEQLSDHTLKVSKVDYECQGNSIHVTMLPFTHSCMHHLRHRRLAASLARRPAVSYICCIAGHHCSGKGQHHPSSSGQDAMLSESTKAVVATKC